MDKLTVLKKIIFVLFILNSKCSFSQILFAEDCFIGGVSIGGHSTLNALYDGQFEIKWEESFSLRKAYAVLYRYGKPEPHSISLNGNFVELNDFSQVGSDINETNPFSNPFAVHVVEITELVTFQNSIVSVDLPNQTTYSNLNWGWWGVYIIIEYTSSEITNPICLRLYIADQSQDYQQNYVFTTPNYIQDTPVVLSLYTHRHADFYEDASRITLNNEVLGDIWSGDLVMPISSTGVQGHFYYQNQIVEGLNGDTANNNFDKQDGVAIINPYLNNNDEQILNMKYLANENIQGFSPRPAFTLTYTPTCPVPTSDMPRAYSFCRGEGATLEALSGYDHYEWSPPEFLSDPSIANPICTADSSGWYRVSMWNDEESSTCSQTIPVFVTVGQTPRPGRLRVLASICPAITGKIIFENMSGTPPFVYNVNGNSQSSPNFENLPPGDYAVSTSDAFGCTWDTLINLPLAPVQQAAFTANPDSGFSPLYVVFNNQSTQATGYQWLVNGQPFSTSLNTSYTFADSGSYEVALVAYRIDETCTDTAFFTIRVDQGIAVIVPNIITPNGDGRNDVLLAQMKGVAFAQWQVYNRWGNMLYEGQSGQIEEELLLWQPPRGERPSGDYKLILTVKGLSGETRQMGFDVFLK